MAGAASGMADPTNQERASTGQRMRPKAKRVQIRATRPISRPKKGTKSQKQHAARLGQYCCGRFSSRGGGRDGRFSSRFRFPLQNRRIFWNYRVIDDVSSNRSSISRISSKRSSISTISSKRSRRESRIGFCNLWQVLLSSLLSGSGLGLDPQGQGQNRRRYRRYRRLRRRFALRRTGQKTGTSPRLLLPI